MITARHISARRLPPTVTLAAAPLLATSLLAMSLVACGTQTGDSSSNAQSSAGSVTVSDAWVRASDGPMTGAFGVVANASDTDVTVVSAQTTASDRTELHEVVMVDGEMAMQQKQDGFVVPAGGEHVLEPGADHVMVMDMTEPILPGSEVEITLTLEDGTSYTYVAQAREAEVGDEEYVPSDGHGDMSADAGSGTDAQS